MLLQRFLNAQDTTYAQALSEINNGRKLTHWMWFIFPQLARLGKSEMARMYGIKDIHEATEFLFHPILGQRLIQISRALLNIKGKSANQVFGKPDDQKLQSSMTLFSCVPGADKVFDEVLDQYFAGEKDKQTLNMIN